MNNQATPDVMTAFQQVFTPKSQFPRWYQPNPNIGPLLCMTQEEEDDYASRDWTPKPLPGSELPPKPLDTQAQIDEAKADLKAQMAKFAEQQAEFFRMVEERTGGTPRGSRDAPSSHPVGSPVASDGYPATHIAGTLSDAPEVPQTVVPGKKK
jgi:hypothetical protein